MVSVDSLFSAHGDIREWLRLPQGRFEWPDRSGLSRLGVLKELEFQNFRLSQAEVGLDFVGCRFSNCSFEN
jgi:hypothetical protein